MKLYKAIHFLTFYFSSVFLLGTYWYYREQLLMYNRRIPDQKRIDELNWLLFCTFFGMILLVWW